MKVWLVDHASDIPAASTSEGRGVRSGIRDRLQSWFNQVANHRSARSNRPQGHSRRINVSWEATACAAGMYDLVLHFVPSLPGQNPPVMGPYREAAAKLRNRELADRLTDRKRGFSGGQTIAASVGGNRVPTLSLVIVLYDAQFSRERARIATNVESLSVIAFHEAAHNKDRSNTLHNAGGGGIFADVHTGSGGAASRPNRDNIAFFADRIWNWGPQYCVGGSMSPVRPP